MVDLDDAVTYEFVDALVKAPAEMFDRMDRTVQGDEQIATGTWITWIRGGNGRNEPCGCLLFDGYGKERDLVDAEDDLVNGLGEPDSEDYIADTDDIAMILLANFYGDGWDERSAYQIFNKYDSWAAIGATFNAATHTTTYERRDGNVLSESGREEIRQVFDVARKLRDS